MYLCLKQAAAPMLPLCWWLCTMVGFVAEGDKLARLVRLS